MAEQDEDSGDGRHTATEALRAGLLQETGEGLSTADLRWRFEEAAARVAKIIFRRIENRERPSAELLGLTTAICEYFTAIEGPD